MNSNNTTRRLPSDLAHQANRRPAGSRAAAIWEDIVYAQRRFLELNRVGRGWRP